MGEINHEVYWNPRREIKNIPSSQHQEHDLKAQIKQLQRQNDELKEQLRKSNDDDIVQKKHDINISGSNTS